LSPAGYSQLLPRRSRLRCIVPIAGVVLRSRSMTVQRTTNHGQLTTPRTSVFPASAPPPRAG
jgi:hypothetical protein